MNQPDSYPITPEDFADDAPRYGSRETDWPALAVGAVVFAACAACFIGGMWLQSVITRGTP